MGMMTPKSQEEVQIAFENAISRGAFSEHGAGYYMFMYRKDGNDYFKHRDTREYIQVPAFSGYK